MRGEHSLRPIAVVIWNVDDRHWFRKAERQRLARLAQVGLYGAWATGFPIRGHSGAASEPPRLHIPSEQALPAPEPAYNPKIANCSHAKDSAVLLPSMHEHLPLLTAPCILRATGRGPAQEAQVWAQIASAVISALQGEPVHWYSPGLAGGISSP